MNIRNNYKHTLAAGYISFITQATINKFAPLLFITFQKDWGITLGQLAAISTYNFMVQLVADLISARFIDKIGATEAYTTNQFSNLYTLLLYYPMPSRFNTLSDTERDSVRTEENIIYQLEVEMNDGTLYKYTYYTLDEMYSGYALCESIEGRINGNGEAEYKAAQIVFDVKSRHIGLIAEKYKIILEGGSFNPMDYIY